MSASVRVESCVFGDPRFELLGAMLSTSKYDALGRMIHIWSYCTDHDTYWVPESILHIYLDNENGPSYMVTAGLAEPALDHVPSSSEPALDQLYYRIKGTDGRIEWLGKQRRGNSKGGKKRASAAKRTKAGKFSRSKPGQSQVKTSSPSSSQPGHSSAITTTTTTAITTAKESPLSPPLGEVKKAEAKFLEKFNRYFSQKRKPGAWIQDIERAMKAGYSPEQLTGAAWGCYKQCCGSDEVLDNCTPHTVLRLKTKDGEKKTLPQWLEMAEVFWREEKHNEVYPWRQQLSLCE